MVSSDILCGEASGLGPISVLGRLDAVHPVLDQCVAKQTHQVPALACGVPDTVHHRKGIVHAWQTVNSSALHYGACAQAPQLFPQTFWSILSKVHNW